METPERVVEPAPPDSMLSLADSTRAVVGLTAGSAEGPAAAPSEARGEIPAGAVVVLPDGRPDFAWYVLSARALVLTGGGALSPMAQLARELAIPTVLTVQHLPVTSLPLGRVVQVDGALGALGVR
jgi:phosphohistidine swiveling domain-containing protein